MESSTGNAGATVTANGQTVEVRAGYPKAVQDDAANWDIINLIQFDTNVFTVQDAGGNNVYIGYNLDAPADVNVSDNNCYARYTETNDPNTPPVVTAVVTGC
ncbi:hypothetical protein [Oceanicoccus sp. KOV_DT_Chl]|uniref:hypothetical protein n=1 Tax=Oceanicoccus sp. KOV_DT_Chl TaxID=1904639 RepID=UPI00190EB489|nr:hypothetical protein [Oceanicoccus sp. KOV_DT_Chl]